MAWDLSAHVGFRREFEKLPKDAQARVKAALSKLVERLDKMPSLDPRKIFASGSYPICRFVFP